MVLFIKAMVLILALLSKDRNFTLARGIGEELGLELDVLLLFLDLHSSVGKHVRNTRKLTLNNFKIFLKSEF